MSIIIAFSTSVLKVHFPFLQWLNVVPWGFYNVIMWSSRRYGRPRLLITENGVDAPGESEKPMLEALDDQFRCL